MRPVSGLELAEGFEPPTT